MAIFNRNSDSGDSVDIPSDVRELHPASAEQKRLVPEGSQGSARTNTFAPTPDSLLSFSFKASSRGPEAPQQAAGVAPARAVPAPSVDDTEPSLIVRRGVTLKGELSACERVVIQGYVEASVTDCGKLEIAEGAIFKGSATVGHAEIAGHVEGVLRVEGKLVVRATARVSGTINYGRLIVEEGAALRGKLEDISSLEASDHDAAQSSSSASEAAAE
ncbi:MAG TPA: polymer-forming cytoskeletal protein [Stellaceae bacterium]